MKCPNYSQIKLSKICNSCITNPLQHHSLPGSGTHRTLFKRLENASAALGYKATLLPLSHVGPDSLRNTKALATLSPSRVFNTCCLTPEHSYIQSSTGPLLQIKTSTSLSHRHAP